VESLRLGKGGIKSALEFIDLPLGYYLNFMGISVKQLRNQFDLHCGG
jgi:hypothetical protein